MNSLKISRPKSEKKSKTYSLRLTQEEYRDLEELKKELKFESLKEILLFGFDIIDKLNEWNKEDYKFYLSPKDKSEFLEVEFELLPNN